MTTVTVKEDITLKNNYDTIADLLGDLDSSIIYEEYLERKMQQVKKAPKTDFVNI